MGKVSKSSQKEKSQGLSLAVIKKTSKWFKSFFIISKEFEMESDKTNWFLLEYAYVRVWKES